MEQEYSAFLSDVSKTLSTTKAKLIFTEISDKNLDSANVLNIFFSSLNSKEYYYEIILFLFYALFFSIIIKFVFKVTALNEAVKNFIFSFFSLTLIYHVFNTINQSYICFKELSLFFGVLSPLAGVLTASGGSVKAAGVQGVSFSIFMSICQVFLNYLLPFIISVFIGISIIDTESGESRMTNASVFIKTTFFTIFAVSVSLIFIFVSFYSKAANTSDTISYKSFKLLLGNAIPIVGGTVSEAMRLVLGSIINTKNHIGIVSVVFVISLCLPFFVILLIYNLILNLFGCFCEYFYISEFKGVLVHLKSAIDFTIASLSVITVLSFININLFMNTAGGLMI